MQLGVAMWVGTGLDVDSGSCSFPMALFIWRKVAVGKTVTHLTKVNLGEPTFPYKMW